MLPAKNRLKSRQEIQKALKKGAFFSFEEVSCKVFPNKYNFSRFAFLVGVKNSGGAVKRNWIKRRMKAVVLDSLKKISPGYDVVFFYSFSILDPKKINSEKNKEGKNGKIQEKMLRLLRISKLI